MHLKRQKATTKLPITRKGTTYVARALSHHSDSVPVVIAVRDMLKLARTTKEVKKMINEKHLKINGNIVKDHRESIRLFNIFEADKPYILTHLPTGKFSFSPSSSTSRLVKITNKKLLKNNKIQLNFHDGTNLISSDKVSVNDSLQIENKKITKHIPLKKGIKVAIISGKYIGMEGKIQAIKNNKALLQIEGKESPIELNISQIIVL
jgi:small subunit ribosomal protein S4e